MSAIAEWYLLPNHRIPDLAAACQPRKRSWLRKPERDYAAFWDWRRTLRVGVDSRRSSRYRSARALSIPSQK